MMRCSKCYAPIQMSFEQLVHAVHCSRCGAGPFRAARSTVWLLILGAAAYLPVMGFVFVELFGVEPEKLIVARHDERNATTGTLVFFIVAIGWLFCWWHIWRSKFARLV